MNNTLQNLSMMTRAMLRMHRYIRDNTVIYDTLPYALIAIILLCLAVFLP